MRLDNYISEIKSEISRNQAQSLIKSGLIKVDEQIVLKPSFKVLKDVKIEILKEKIYVSRAGDKLNLFFEKHNYINVENLSVLDIGASTGGFTEVLLEKNAKHIVSLDVGTLQLSKKLRNNPKIESIENMDIRQYSTNLEFDLITCDVSFISLLSIIDSIDNLAKDKIIILFKPQFEVGREVKRDRNGVLLDNKAVEDSLKNFIKKAESLNWNLLISEKSQLKGKEGNEEYFLFFTK